MDADVNLSLSKEVSHSESGSLHENNMSSKPRCGMDDDIHSCTSKDANDCKDANDLNDKSVKNVSECGNELLCEQDIQNTSVTRV